MEPLTLISTALVAAASAGGTAMVSEAAKDAYSKLKKALIERFARKCDVGASLTMIEKAPQSRDLKHLLEGELEKGGAPEDHEILDLSQLLMNLLQKEGMISSTRYQAVLTDSGAIAQGRGAVAAGKGGIAVGGSFSGGITLTDRQRKDE